MVGDQAVLNAGDIRRDHKTVQCGDVELDISRQYLYSAGHQQELAQEFTKTRLGRSRPVQRFAGRIPRKQRRNRKKYLTFHLYGIGHWLG